MADQDNSIEDITLMADQDNSIVSAEEEGERRREVSIESDIPCNQLALRQGSQESQSHSKNTLDLSLCLEELRGVSPSSQETTPTGSSSQLSYQERRQLVQLFLEKEEEEEEEEEGGGEEEEEQEMTQIVTSDDQDVHDTYVQ